MEAAISMGSNLYFLGVVLILELDVFFPVLYHVSAHRGGGKFSIWVGVCNGPVTEVISEVRALALSVSLGLLQLFCLGL